MPLHIGFLLFPNLQLLDMAGPYDVLASLPDVRMHLIGRDLQPLRSSTGAMLTPDMTFAACPALDILCVPGGSGVEALLEDRPTLDFLRTQASHVRYLTSVCTGALLLGAAGLLQGKRATTHWAFHSLLSACGAIPVAERVVRDGNLFTGGGVTAGIDFALTLAEELFGTETAQLCQLEVEYAPAPPLNAGRPETAPVEIVTLARQQNAAALQRRADAIARALAA